MQRTIIDRDTKIAYVKEIIAGTMSAASATRELGVSAGTVSDWLRKCYVNIEKILKMRCLDPVSRNQKIQRRASSEKRMSAIN